MSLTMRIFFFALIGIIAGILAWPLAELAIYLQADFPSLLIYSIVVGIAIGLFMGACFGMFEGITSHSSHKLKSGIIMGLIIGIFSGVIGVLIGQAALIFLGTTFFVLGCAL